VKTGGIRKWLGGKDPKPPLAICKAVTAQRVSMQQLIELLRNRGYAIDGAGFSTGRPDRTTIPLVSRTGRQVVGKVYPNGGGGRTYANMQRLWHSSFGQNRHPPGLPEPIEYLPEQSVLIMEHLGGRPLLEFERVDQDLLGRAIGLLAELHQCEAEPEARRDSRGILRSARRKAKRIVALAPQLAELIAAVLETMEQARPDDTELVPSHGDFSARNILVGADRVAFIDWDRFQWADPARDLVYIGTWSWAWALRRSEHADWSVLDRALSVYCSLRPRANIQKQVGFHVAAALLRISHSLLEFWPEEATWVPHLAAEALRVLK
jgi:hypothetical protein